MAEEKVIEKVVVIIAMEAEAAPLIERLGFQMDFPSRFEAPAPFQSYSGTVGSVDVTIVTSGKCKTTAADNVGTVPAALATYLSLQTLQPDLLINAGTAGGFISQGASIGDVYVSTSCVNHDRRMPIPLFEEYGIGLKPSISTKNLREKLGLKGGVVSTGNSLGYTEECMEIMKEHSAKAKEMEAAAVAWVADLFGTPLFCVKAITDLVDGEKPPEDEFLENLEKASNVLKETTRQILLFLDGKKPSQL